MELLQTTPKAVLPSHNGNTSEQTDLKSSIEDYNLVRTKLIEWMKSQNGKQPGDPVASARAIVDVVRGEVDVPREPVAKAVLGNVESKPLSEATNNDVRRAWPDLDMLVLGSDAEANIREKCERVVRNLDDWKEVVRSIDLKD